MCYWGYCFGLVRWEFQFVGEPLCRVSDKLRTQDCWRYPRDRVGCRFVGDAHSSSDCRKPQARTGASQCSVYLYIYSVFFDVDDIIVTRFVARLSLDDSEVTGCSFRQWCLVLVRLLHAFSQIHCSVLSLYFVIYHSQYQFRQHRQTCLKSSMWCTQIFVKI